jgi:hypothetical protein
MLRSLKLVAVTLVLVILSLPSLAAVTCFSGVSPAAMHCPAGCPMMASADKAPALQLSVQQHSGAPCCNISNVRPSPSVVLQAPVTRVSIAPQDVSTAPGLVPASFMVRCQQTRPVRLPESPQSLLCVFLI